jgi:hypothetical protein
VWYPLTRTALERQESLQTQQRQRSPCVDGEIDGGRNDEIVGVGLNLKSLDERRTRPTFTVALAVTIFMVESLSLLVRCPLSVEASTMLLVLVWCTDGVRRRCWCWPGGAPTENQPVKRNSVDHNT